MKFFSEKNILISGGTGSFGQALVKELLTSYPEIQSLTVFSRDEYKQYQMQISFPADQFPKLTFVLGDIRDEQALSDALKGKDIVIHAAALKQNPAGELYPDEFIKTNVDGTRHLIRAAKSASVSHVLALSTDKAVYPTGAYGASKLCAEKLLMAAQQKSRHTLFSVLRLGNLLGSRASVIPALLQAKDQREVKITHPDMTRFSLSMSESVDRCLEVIPMMQGGEIFVPEMDAYRLGDLVTALLPQALIKAEGPRAAEKKHELAFSDEEARYSFSYAKFFVICPVSESYEYWITKAEKLSSDFVYSSKQAKRMLSVEQIKHLVQFFN